MHLPTPNLPAQADIAIIGAGPQALTLATHLLQKRSQMQEKIVVLDPNGFWMHQWQRLFSMLEISHLRSPAVHQPDPNPYALHQFAKYRSDELFSPHDLPGAKLFQDFCQTLVSRWQLQQRVYRALVQRITPVSSSRPHLNVELKDGKSLVAQRVVLAVGGGMPNFPGWVSKIATPYPKHRLCHSHEIDLRRLRLRGERILVVGGGLTSGHLAVGAAARGAQVLLLSRRRLSEKWFDADPAWLESRHCQEFAAERDWEARWEMIQQARNGGSITPDMMAHLRHMQQTNQVTLHQRCQVVRAEWRGDRWQVYCQDGATLEGDRIWLATGTKLNATQNPLLADVLEAFPTGIVNGLPVLDDHLRWPGCNLFLMGGLAALQIGPTARNLAGARLASDRIVTALTKPSPVKC
jgi:cation diffusion facilitator CzcD-associated flavoprotein CzcO